MVQRRFGARLCGQGACPSRVCRVSRGASITRWTQQGLVAGTAGICAGVVMPTPAVAHGLGQQADLPLPGWLFAWAASIVLVVSFVALGLLWREPRLERAGWRPLAPRLGLLITSRPVQVAAGAVGVGGLAAGVWSGLAGVQNPSSNLAPTLVYVVFWVGLVPASVLLGDVFRAVNPWRAVGRATGWVARMLHVPLPAPLAYPSGLGRWPAVAGLLAFAWLELVYADGNLPRTVAVAALAYSAVTFVAMALFGVERWIERGEAFSVYFNLFSRIAPIEVRGRQIGVRPLLSGLAALEWQPGTVALLAVMLGAITFDGATSGPLWGDVAPDLTEAFASLGAGPGRSVQLAWSVGLVAAVLGVYSFYRLGIAGVRSVGGRLGSPRLARAFAHSLVPIALVYVGAHYLSSLVYQGQAATFLASDPLGHGWDMLGTAGGEIDYGLLGAGAIWWIQVMLVVGGHIGGLTLAHDRALVLYRRPRLAVRSQHWLLGVMVGFTGLALLLLSEANA